eukprot:COSAG01_NODE_64229_length_277_cov_0.848315_1_plen_40_part_10
MAGSQASSGSAAGRVNTPTAGGYAAPRTPPPDIYGPFDPQ